MTARGDCPICPMLATDRDDALSELDRLAAEVDRLSQWKAEATSVIERWDALWEWLGRPGQLGEFQQTGVYQEFLRLRGEVDRLRTENTRAADFFTEHDIADWVELAAIVGANRRLRTENSAAAGALAVFYEYADAITAGADEKEGDGRWRSSKAVDALFRLAEKVGNERRAVAGEPDT